MKFGKAFKKQKVPEWTEAYVDYNGLKHVLQEIRRLKQSKQPPTPLRSAQKRNSSGLNLQARNSYGMGDIEDQAIAVNTVKQQNSRKLYNTEFLLSPEEGGENEKTFFRKLDEELNKVNTFYKDKVEEVINEASLLNKQMDALIAFRTKVMNPHRGTSSSPKGIPTDVKNSAVSKTSSPSRAAATEQTDLESPVELQHLNNGKVTGSSLREDANVRENETHSLDILDRVKITNPLESPISTIRGFLMDEKEKGLSFNKDELKKVEERLKNIFSEYYKKLQLLKNYSFMNLSAFSKILKKYEKITSRNAARPYMRMVDSSYLGSCDEVSGLLDRVEATFIKHFAKSNRREGMKLLRPKQKTEKHCITFFSGFFSGFTIALLIAVILLLEAKRLIDEKDGNLYINSILPLYSFHAYLVLHTLLYAANIYLWRRYRINYPFIFGFKQGTELGYQEVFLLGNGLAMLALATFLVHLHIQMDSGAQDHQKYAKFMPLGLITVIFIIMFCPFNIVYHSSRVFLRKSIFRCICAPLYKVTLPDFFLADQLTSQIQAMRSIEYYICYYAYGTSKGQNKCTTRDVYAVFYFIIGVIPYWLRFLQCVRRLLEERDYCHGCNAVRYFSTIIAVVIRTAFELRKGLTWKILAIASSAIATIMNTYWDIVVDWGLLHKKSNNFLLRDKLVLSHKSVYFSAMVLDVLLRFAWVQLVFPFDLHSLSGNAILITFSSLEILRRGMWNFFRLENEHLNNVGKYRAFKSVPLPFNYNDENDDETDDKDD
ncbi:phosphate transporter PHO1 homolog 10-like isoform X1 [Coffea arabica]|uniref:Phosphate transporter PHO1 homolog 10-like isoform X1 n=1 Tax=Coffea arabica TaxID=13443 RepID=A0ABM4W2L5_COFAR